MVDVANPATVDALLEHALHLDSPRDLDQGYLAATATRDEIWCIVRQKLHGVTSSVSWSIVLLESEEVSCYGQKVLTEQDVTVISAINFYTRLNEHQFGNSKYRHGNRHHDMMTVAETMTVAITSLPITLRATVSKLIGIFQY